MSVWRLLIVCVGLFALSFYAASKDGWLGVGAVMAGTYIVFGLGAIGIQMIEDRIDRIDSGRWRQ